MKIGFLTNIVSPHQVPLAKELARQVGVENFLYVYSEPFHEERAKLGWQSSVEGLIIRPLDAESRDWLEGADFVYTTNRDFELMEYRLAAGRTTYYMSERWFKPIPIGCFYLPGSIRLLVPSYRRMCRRFVLLFDNPKFRYCAFGPWAKHDMMTICQKIVGRTNEEKIIPWGYFVEPGHPELRKPRPEGAPLRILWVGRMLDWKRVDTIIRAVRENVRREVALTLVGDGPEKPRLQRMAQGLPVTFLPSQPIEKIRELMRESDVYVLASDAQEGWGAALNEALEEGMSILGTHEAGSSAAILPECNLYPCGDFRVLAEKLAHPIPLVPIGEWSAAHAAQKLLDMI